MSGKVLRLRSASMSSRIIDGFSHGASLTRDGDVEVSAFMESYHCFACHEEDMLHNLPQIEAHVSIWEKLSEQEAQAKFHQILSEQRGVQSKGDVVRIAHVGMQKLRRWESTEVKQSVRVSTEVDESVHSGHLLCYAVLSQVLLESMSVAVQFGIAKVNNDSLVPKADSLSKFLLKLLSTVIIAAAKE